MLNRKNQNFIKKLDQICVFLNAPDNLELLDNTLVSTLKQELRDIKSTIEQTDQTERNLSVGVMGAMKAGKSSFLNALLFNGKDVLPKAATPMTASLTVLSYSPQEQASITFFNKEDWKLIKDEYQRLEKDVSDRFEEELKKQKSIKQQALNITYSLTGRKNNNEQMRPQLTREEIRDTLLAERPERRAYYELYQQIQKNNLLDNIDKYVNRTEHLNISLQKNKLYDYVGADGKYTPLVKSIELKLNNENLKYLNIIDTPGLNDPFTSRSRSTQQFLGQCDAVLYVCSVSQFITKPDVDFICKDMTEKATADAYIIGSQIDSGVLQYNATEHSFKTAYQESTNTYDQQAQNILEQQQDKPIVKSILKHRPIYISSLMYAIALKKQNNQSLNKDEAYIIKQLQKRFTDFNEVFESLEDYFELAGICRIKDSILPEILKNKQKLINEKNNKYISTVTYNLIEKMSELQQKPDNTLASLQDQNTDQYQKMQKQQATLKDLSRDIEDAIADEINSLHSLTENIKFEIASAIKNHTYFKTEKRTSTSTRQEGIIFKDIITKTTEDNYTYTTYVINNIENYVTATQGIIKEHLSSFKSQDNLIQTLKQLINNKCDPDISNEIIRHIKSQFSKFTLHSIDLSRDKDVSKLIQQQFPQEQVLNEEISKLGIAQKEKLNQIRDDMFDELDKQMTEIRQFLEKQQNELCNNVQEAINRNYEEITKMKQNSERYISRIKQLKFQLAELQQNLTMASLS